MSLLFEALRAKVAEHPDKTALIEDDARWTYAQVSQRVIKLSDTLAKQGLRAGDRVALMFLNQKEFLLGLFAALRLGLVVVPINIQLPPEDIAYVILNSGARLVMTTARFAPLFEGKGIPLLVANQGDAPQFPSLEAATDAGDDAYWPDFERDANTLSFLIYTSGTTGRPKGVMLTEENIYANTQGFREAVGFEESDVLLMALPLFHAYGLTVCLYAFTLGATIALSPSFNPRKIISLIAQERVTVLPLVPTVLSFLAENLTTLDRDLFRSLKMCITGGASLPQSLLRKLRDEANLVVLEGYGLTEASPVVAVNRVASGNIAGSVGKPLFNVQVRIVGDDNRPFEWRAGEETPLGEIQVKGPNVMMGYYGLEDATREAMADNGWLRTGDLGHLDGDGNLYISGGRKKDLIIKAGENLSPLRIEEALLSHPAVAEACVFGVPDERLGEDIFAAFALRHGQSVEINALRKYCLERLTPFMTPRYFRVYDELPKNATGKILRKRLEEENAQAAQSSVS
ncbi:MAG: AMP-binding protein [Vampirovibrionales bacterium]|nr:AMP-binding protein [Vampirovibrionales bacterium]